MATDMTTTVHTTIITTPILVQTEAQDLAQPDPILVTEEILATTDLTPMDTKALPILIKETRALIIDRPEVVQTEDIEIQEIQVEGPTQLPTSVLLTNQEVKILG